MSYWWGYLGLHAQETASQATLRNCSKDWEQVGLVGRSWFIQKLATGAGSPNIKRLLLMKENQKPQVEKFSTFLHMGNYMTCHEIKTLTPWKKSYDQPRQHIKKQRHYFANEVLSSQSYGFSSGHVWM